MGTVSLDLTSLSISTIIGKGDYNVKVYLGKNNKTDELYALKVYELEKCDLSLKIIQHEIWMYRQLKHKNILPLASCFDSFDNVYMVFPLMGFGSCKDLIHAEFRTGFPELAIAYILKDVVSALDYLHSKHVIHRSVKGSHVMISASGNVVLSGFRHCYSMLRQGSKLRTVHDFPNFYVNSLNWASRELLEQNLAGYNTKSDIYSLGILSCELGNGVIPFYDMPMTQMLLNKIEGNIPTLLDVTTYSELNPKPSATENQIPEGYKRTFSSHFHNFVKTCLSFDPKLRPSASSLESHWFFKQTKSKNQPNLLSLLRPLSPLDWNTIRAPEFHEDDMVTMGSLDIDIEWNF